MTVFNHEKVQRTESTFSRAEAIECFFASDRLVQLARTRCAPTIDVEAWNAESNNNQGRSDDSIEQQQQQSCCLCLRTISASSSHCCRSIRSEKGIFSIFLTLENIIDKVLELLWTWQYRCLLIYDFSLTSLATIVRHYLNCFKINLTLSSAPTLNRSNESSTLVRFSPSLLLRRIWLQTSRIRRLGQLPHQLEIEVLLCERSKKVCKQPWWTSTIGFVRLPIKTFHGIT